VKSLHDKDLGAGVLPCGFALNNFFCHAAPLCQRIVSLHDFFSGLPCCKLMRRNKHKSGPREDVQ
jgi:hypothetical protein